MEKQTLKPCPKCGSEELILAMLNFGSLTGAYGYACVDCGCLGKFALTEERARELWNKMESDNA